MFLVAQREADEHGLWIIVLAVMFFVFHMFACILQPCRSERGMDCPSCPIGLLLDDTCRIDVQFV